MKTVNENSIENAKKIVGILNDLKAHSFTFTYCEDLVKKLRELKCPYPSQITYYLSRKYLIVNRGNWYTFSDRKPFDFYNFICVVDRIKEKNNKNRKRSKIPNSVDRDPKSTSSLSTIYKTEEYINLEVQKDTVKKEFLYVENPTKWTKFLLKLFFEIKI